MKYFNAVTTTLAIASVAVASSSAALEKRALTPVTITGNAFMVGSTRFYIRGVDYQPGGSSDPVDPLANPTTCQRDIAYFKQLGINTVRVYTIDNTANHDTCMNALADAGIYVALDVNNYKYSINRAAPAASYNAVYLQNVFAVIDAFAGYTNTLLFFSGNEVVNDPTNTDCAPFIKAVDRDMRAYIKARKYRSIPVGYSAADVTSNRYQLAAWMNCGNATDRSDFFSFNSYSWCDPNTFVGSGWSDLVALYSNYSIPLFLSEYGCNENPPREFQEVQALYSTQMTSVYSGGLVYEWSEEPDNPNFGLVNINSATAITPKTDYNNLMAMYKANPSPTGDGGYKSSGTPLECPPQSPNWNVSTSVLPVMPPSAQYYFSNGAGKGPGLSGPGSQTSGATAQGPGVPASAASGTSTSGSSSGTATPAKSAAGGSLKGQENASSFALMAAVVAVSFLVGATGSL